MISGSGVRQALDTMILSASGWRGIFAADGAEHSASSEISPAHTAIAAAAGHCFAEFVQAHNVAHTASPLILTGSDTRPTGKAIAEAIISALLASGCQVKWAGYSAIPEIMAWARGAGETGEQPIGFIYISASHNPIGHNGLKFGFSDGGVLAPEKNAALVSQFRAFIEANGNLPQSITGTDPAQLRAVYAAEAESKQEAYRAYMRFSAEVAWGKPSRETSPLRAFSDGGKPLGIVCDFNGSARSASIDKEFFSNLGIGFKAINDIPGKIVHSIIPEGASLEPCRHFLEETRREDSSFVMGYTPDCDGDRGNLVIWDDTRKQTRILEAQEVFALACVAELSHLAWKGELAYDANGGALTKAALVVNDPTSLRIEKIAAAFGVSVFRAEVGEANAVGLARKLRLQGYLVRILGEGSNGGCIIHPAAVRDPLNTVVSLIKLLAIKSEPDKPGPFELWLKLSNQPELYRENFGIGDIIASLPQYVTTGADDEQAILKIKTQDHSALKNRYQQIFLAGWEEKQETLKTRYRICAWEAAAYNGIEEKRGIANFGEAGKGGLKICFFDEAGIAAASIWMRGSATEPVFRVMADAAGADKCLERELLEWQRRMVLEADTACQA